MAKIYNEIRKIKKKNFRYFFSSTHIFHVSTFPPGHAYERRHVLYGIIYIYTHDIFAFSIPIKLTRDENESLFDADFPSKTSEGSRRRCSIITRRRYRSGTYNTQRTQTRENKAPRNNKVLGTNHVRDNGVVSAEGRKTPKSVGITFDGAHHAARPARPAAVWRKLQYWRIRPARPKHNARRPASSAPKRDAYETFFYARFAPNAVPVRTCRFIVNAIVGHEPSPGNHTRGNREQ